MDSLDQAADNYEERKAELQAQVKELESFLGLSPEPLYHDGGRLQNANDDMDFPTPGILNFDGFDEQDMNLPNFGAEIQSESSCCLNVLCYVGALGVTRKRCYIELYIHSAPCHHPHDYTSLLFI